MTNEQLATFIHSGENEELIPLLWDKVRAFVYLKASQYYESHTAMCAARGVELWDIKQAGYIAFTVALRAFKPESGFKFITFIGFPFRNAVNDLLGVRNKTADALNGALSLDIPVKEDDTDGATLGDFQPDEQSTEFVDHLESESISEFIREKVNALEERQRAVIVMYYFDGKTLGEIAAILNISSERARQIKHKAEVELRRSQELRTIYNEYYRSHTYSYYDKYFAWQPENFEAVRREEAAARKLAKEKTVAEILAEYRALYR